MSWHLHTDFCPLSPQFLILPINHLQLPKDNPRDNAPYLLGRDSALLDQAFISPGGDVISRAESLQLPSALHYEQRRQGGS